jgi:hypothetical protein
MQDNWKLKVFLIGGILGALTGVGAAYLLIQRAEQENTQPRLSAGEGVSLGLGILGLMRQLASMGQGK